MHFWMQKSCKSVVTTKTKSYYGNFYVRPTVKLITNKIKNGKELSRDEYKETRNVIIATSFGDL